MDADSNERLVTDDLADAPTRLEPVAKSLNCADELAAVSDIYRDGASTAPGSREWRSMTATSA